MKRIITHPFFWMIIFSPLFLWLLILLLPTFDDWTYLTTPCFDNFFSERLLPYKSYWRPFDAAFGYVLGLNYRIFPTLNHICIYTGHLASAFVLYRIMKFLGLRKHACNIALLFFFFSPAMLGTVFDIDSMNQVYAQFWGLVALWIYLNKNKPTDYILWFLCVYLATFSKENGITWFVLPQLIALSFNRIKLKDCIHDTLLALIPILLYFIARYFLTPETVTINDEYLDFTLHTKLRNISLIMMMTWLPFDYVAVFYAPERNLLLAAITLITVLPFLYILFWKNRKNLFDKTFVILFICTLISTSPHLLTVASAMHAYASLAIAAIIVAYLIDKCELTVRLKIAFGLFLVSCLFIDAHHWIKAYESGMTGRRMSIEAIQKTGKPIQKAYVIAIEPSNDKYSMFCVQPRDCFAWGYSTRQVTGYQWPEILSDTNIVENDQAIIDRITNKAFKEGFERVWVLRHDTVEVVAP